MEFRNRHEIYDHYMPMIRDSYEKCEWGDYERIHKEMEEEISKFSSCEKARRSSMTPQERTRAAVYARGNRWQIENFNATH